MSPGGPRVRNRHGRHRGTCERLPVDPVDEAQLAAELDHLRNSPRDVGRLEAIVCRPAVGERIELIEGQLDPEVGLVGDTWNQRSSKRTADGSPHPDMQLNVINARVAQTVARDRSRWALAGDQLYVDLHLGPDNLAAWTRLAIGTAVIEVTDQPHTGCAKFTERFGLAAHRFVNSPEGKAINARGINARVVVPGTVTVGDTITVVGRSPA